MNKKLLILLLAFVPYFGFAQYNSSKMKKKKASTGTNNNFAKRKKKPRPEFIVGVGASNFLGELGGANQIGTFFVRDLEFKATRPSSQVAIRYKFNNRLAVKGGVYYNLLSGSDKLTKEPFRHNRNLSFRSNTWELSVQGEFFITKEQQGARYKIKNAKGVKNYDFQAYIFVGVGGFYYNPQARYKGRWENLQPLSTEGQGLPGGPKEYKRFGFCIPYGIGVKEAITKEWAIGLEIGMRKTFTDYIDDVSGLYYDNNAIRAAKGDMAADLADPSLMNMPEEYGGNKPNVGLQSAAGQVRGHSNHKDAYMFINVTASYKIPAKRRTRSKF